MCLCITEKNITDLYSADIEFYTDENLWWSDKWNY